MKLTEGIQKFCAELVQLKRSPATVVAYQKDLEQMQEAVGDVEIAQITGEQIQNFLNSILAKGYSTKSASRKLNSIKSFFKFLLKENVVLVDVSKPIPHPQFSVKLPRVLTPTEYRGLRDAARPNIKIYTIVEVMLQTGLRIGEISRIKLEHVKLTQKPPQVLIVEFGSSPMRLVELNKIAVKAIKDYLPLRQEVAKDKGYLFNTKNGGNMLIRNIRSAVNRIFSKAGVKNATVNDLRNTFITVQLENGVSLSKIAMIVGHKRTTSTENYLPLISRPKAGNKSKIVEL